VYLVNCHRNLNSELAKAGPL